MSSRTSSIVPYKPLDLGFKYSSFLDGFDSGLQVPFVGDPTKWMEQYVRFPHSARSTKFHETTLRQLKDPINEFFRRTTKNLYLLIPPGGGKTTLIEALACYIVDQAPGPTQIVTQTDDTAKFWSETRLMPVLEACEPVSKLFPRKKDDKRKMEIIFAHMFFLIAAANMTNFQEKSLQYAIGDEAWKWSDLIAEFKARLHDRWNGKFMLASQGGWTGDPWDVCWQEGTQHRWGFVCPGTIEGRKCDQWVQYTWDHVNYTKKLLKDGSVDWPLLRQSVYYQCPFCEARYQDNARDRRMLHDLAHYEQQNFSPLEATKSFHYPAYSVWWIKWADLAVEWVKANEAKHKNDPDLLRVFLQKRKAEPADEDVIEVIESAPIYERRENYGNDDCTVQLPDAIQSISAGVDVQGDRIEVEFDGWGDFQESWALDYRVIYGPTDKPEIWKELDKMLYFQWVRLDGAVLGLDAMAIDTGHVPNDVYNFVKPRAGQHVYAIKGSSEANMPIVSRPRKSGVEKVRLFMVGTDTAKTRIYTRLGMKEAGPGYMHYPTRDCFDPEYFKQLTSEKVVAMVRDGVRVKKFRRNGRNEPLDLRVYGMAALMIRNPRIGLLKKNQTFAPMPSSVPPQEDDEEGETPPPSSQPRYRKKRSGWMRGY